MKKALTLFLILTLLLCGCTQEAVPDPSQPPEYPALVDEISQPIPYSSRFDSVTTINLSDSGIQVNSGDETDSVFTSHDIIYYEDKLVYESGNPYGEGEEADRHSAEDAAAHTVVNITAPGAYRVTGKLSAGQIRVDLGENVKDDPNAVVELILDGADITCTVAPAILFLNVYECDGGWSVDSAKAEVDTSGAGANLILAEDSRNTVQGSHVAKIFKDQDEEKKLWKQDGAIYSYMSMNVFGPGTLELKADNEGLDTELHLTINGGDIAIRSDNDGINTNEDGVSVTTINAGTLHIIAGLGDEGDGIDSNGYLVINGGTVVSSANPISDAGLDSDLGSSIHGGTVIALGSTMDWAESDSRQVTLNLQFTDYQSSDSAIAILRQDGAVAFAYDPSEDEVLGNSTRHYMGAVISCPNLTQGLPYEIYLGGTISGEESGGVYHSTTITAHTGGTRMQYSGTDVTMGPGGFGGMGGEQRPGMGGEKPDGQPPELPQGDMPGGFHGQQHPDGEIPSLPEGEPMPGYFHGPAPGGNRGPQGSSEGNSLFYMQDKVNAFSGVSPAEP